MLRTASIIKSWHGELSVHCARRMADGPGKLLAVNPTFGKRHATSGSQYHQTAYHSLI